MTDRELKQRCLELGYEEEKIDQIINETYIWSIVCNQPDNYFAKIFGSKYDNEIALRKLIDNCNALMILNAVNDDRKRNPKDYEVTHDESGPWPIEEERFRRKINNKKMKNIESAKNEIIEC